MLKSEQEYNDLGIDLFQVERGGDVTFHGPGQWVLYPILHLGGNEADSHGYLFNLEEIAIKTLASFSVDGFRREGNFQYLNGRKDKLNFTIEEVKKKEIS